MLHFPVCFGWLVRDSCLCLINERMMRGWLNATGFFFYLQRLEMGIPQAGKAPGFWQWVTVLSWMQPELVSALSSFHTCTHTLLGPLQPPRDGSGGAKLLLLFPWLRSLKMCKMHVCTSEPPAAWKHTWLHREKGKIASGNVLNVQKVENMRRVGEPVWDGHCSLKKGQNGPGKFRGQICDHVGQTHEKLHLVCRSSEQRMGIRTGHKCLCALGSHVLTD